MRHAALRLALFATVSLTALPALAQEEPTIPPVQMDAPRAVPPVAVEPVAEEAKPPSIPEVWAPVPVNGEQRSAYGLYLAGRLAMSRGEASVAADYLAEANALTPEQPLVRQQAFTTALFGGDLDLAARTAPAGDDAPPVLAEAGRLIDVVEMYADGDADGALLSLTDRPIGSPHARPGLYVRAFIAAETGDLDTALRLPTANQQDPTSLFLRFHRALIFEALGRNAEAEEDYKVLMATRAGPALFSQQWGEFLERRGRRDEALAVYDAAIAAGRGDRGIVTARDRVVARRRPPAALTLREGAAQALSAAAVQASVEGAHEFGAVYLRLALRLDPSDELQLRLGQTLAEAKLEVAAREALGAVGRADPALFAVARTEMALSLEREERYDEALAELRVAAAANPKDIQVAYLLAALLLQLEHYDESLAVLNGPLLNTADQGFEIHFLRGAAYESRGDVELAEAELWQALQLRPDDANTLNYLGYLWVDSGRRVDQGAEMIARAHASEPENGNIQDSLGWSQYRQGQYDLAVVTLEGAVDKEPANAEINDHLGDAYWQVGRRREAQFQWTRVLTLDPDDQRRSEVERKLAEGLAPAVPVAATPEG